MNYFFFGYKGVLSKTAVELGALGYYCKKLLLKLILTHV